MRHGVQVAVERDRRLNLFGGFRLMMDGREVRLSSAKQQGLLAYLALAMPRRQPRCTIVELLWGNRFEEQARQSLRQALTGIRREIGAGLLICDKHTIALAHDAFECDVARFLALASEGSKEGLLTATRMFGEFLLGTSVHEDGFSDWVSHMREQLTGVQVNCLHELAQHALEAGCYVKAAEHLEAAVMLDGFREDIHRLLMRALALAGRRADALRNAEALSAKLQREFGVGLSPETEELVVSIRESGQAIQLWQLPPQQEERRLAALRRYDLLDTPPDGAFDRITAIAANLFSVPISVISLVDEDRIWFKSHHGIDVDEIERKPGLCASAILQHEPWILPDARENAVALTNPLVAGEFGLRFYAGVPLRTSDGHNLGTLCVIDREPRPVAERELNFLKDLASIVMDQMELRLAARRAVSDLSINGRGTRPERDL